MYLQFNLLGDTVSCNNESGTLSLLHVCSRLGASSFGIGASALGLVHGQQALGLTVSVWTLDTQSEQIKLEQNNALVPGTMRRFFAIGPGRFGLSPKMEYSAQKSQGQFDVLHQHEIWTMNSRVTNVWRRSGHGPSVVTIHGALSPQALQRSQWKKRLALTGYESSNLKNVDCLHALSRREAQSIRAYGLSAPIAVIPNGVASTWLTSEGSSVRFRQKHRLPADKRIMLFLGRISPIKGLPMLISAIARLKPHMKEWILVIAGVDEFDHIATLRGQIDDLNLQKSVRIIGPQFAQDKSDALAAAELFVLPSYSEASPISLLEAMAMGVPVLTTSAAPWEELNQLNCGWCTEISECGIVDALAEALYISSSDLSLRGQLCKSLVANRYTWNRIAECTRQMYNWLLSTGPEPHFMYQA